ncbi:hypothetical protein Nepgr_016094 [Nepenthes gracilis]|uniref:Avr9/Cf-9 rapidly elicited protein 146 n=1 Tax=Nepenthes gracilis TaxID=150966 RepID=A0AAD3SM35_NEPGR|nr:hypothetical protein Nepgr_016094 [Nepenthes gracilis]
MENTLLVMAKRLRNAVRVVLIMLREGISRRKLPLDLNMMTKRGKIAGKALRNLMFHLHASASASASSSAPGEYEFSCSNTPSHNFLPFKVSKRKSHNDSHSNLSACSYAPQTNEGDCNNSLELMHQRSDGINYNDAILQAALSPTLRGMAFGRSPAVRQLRITDSPFPSQSFGDDNNLVDEAAEEFIRSFYEQLKE